MIRAATSDDLTRLVDLESLCFGTAAWGPQLLGAAVRAGEVLMIEGDGFAIVRVVAEVADLDRIAVHPDRRGRGVARELLVAVLEHARSAGALRIMLEVAADNTAAIALYDGAGFAEIHRRRRYYRDGVDALVMQLPLR